MHVTETAALKLGALIRSVNFPSPEVRVNLIGLLYCCRVWAVALNCKLKMFGKVLNHARMVVAAI